MNEVAQAQLEAVIQCVCTTFRVSRAELFGNEGHGRRSSAAWARHVTWYILRGQQWTLREIGEAFGRRDGSSISHGVARVALRIRAVSADAKAVAYVAEVLMPDEQRRMIETCDIEAAIERIDRAVATATAIRGVLVTRLTAAGRRSA